MTSTILLILLIAALALAGLGFLGRHRGVARRRAQAKSSAEELVPEIRAVMTACDPNGASSGEPPATPRFSLSRQRLPGMFSEDVLFAVETFYQCVDAYGEAARAMTQAFSEGSRSSVGDRIRAKDRRDRCLKDVYYTGEMALERLRELI